MGLSVAECNTKEESNILFSVLNLSLGPTVVLLFWASLGSASWKWAAALYFLPTTPQQD